MTEPAWKYKTQQRTEQTFVMELRFEEDLTLHALRAFVEATKDISGWSEVSIGTGQRTGHEEVIVLRAITTAGGVETVEGPQLPDDGIADTEVADEGPRIWAKAENVPYGVQIMPAADANGFSWMRVADPRGYFVQFYNGKLDGQTHEDSLTANWPDGFLEVRR